MSSKAPNARLRLMAGTSAAILLLGLLLFGLNRPVSPSHSFRLPLHHSTKARSSDVFNDVFNATLGFQKILVINLPDRTDRRDSMSLAAAYSNLEVEYVDGVRIAEEDLESIRKILPPGGLEKSLKAAALGSWRAHLNAVRRIVEQNLTSALIIEDDVDWDLRIKMQMRDFAIASGMLIQPLANSTDKYLDPTYPKPSAGQKWQNFEWTPGVAADPTTSPYGDVDRWDLLWLGHCGTVFPKEDSLPVPMGRVVMSNDETVPEQKHVNVELGGKDLLNDYPSHTRVVSRARRNICSTAYALSRHGARRTLYEMGVHKQDGAMDVMLGALCDGIKERDLAKCLTVQPALFQHHRPVALKSTFSDISGWGGRNKVAHTNNIRLSTRINFPQLSRGDTEYFDSYPNDG